MLGSAHYVRSAPLLLGRSPVVNPVRNEISNGVNRRFCYWVDILGMVFVSIIISFATAMIEFFIGQRLVVIIPYAFIVPILLLVPRILAATVPAIKNNGLPAQAGSGPWLLRIELLSFFVLVFNAPASLFFHKMGFQYDRFLHFAAGFLMFLIFFHLCSLFVKGGANNHKNRILFVSVIVIFLGNFFWEGLQHTTDDIFGTKLFFDIKQSANRDFLEDVIFGFSGMLAAVFYIVYSFKKIAPAADSGKGGEFSEKF